MLARISLREVVLVRNKYLIVTSDKTNLFHRSVIARRRNFDQNSFQKAIGKLQKILWSSCRRGNLCQYQGRPQGGAGGQVPPLEIKMSSIFCV